MYDRWPELASIAVTTTKRSSQNLVLYGRRGADDPYGTRAYPPDREEGAKLWRAIFAFAGDREIASDAVAEAFAQYAPRAELVRQPAAWIWRAAFKIAAGELQRRPPQSPMPAQLTCETVDHVPVMEALARLGPRQRAAIVLHYYAGYSASEIAQISGDQPHDRPRAHAPGPPEARLAAPGG